MNRAGTRLIDRPEFKTKPKPVTFLENDKVFKIGRVDCWTDGQSFQFVQGGAVPHCIMPKLLKQDITTRCVYRILKDAG